MAPTNYGRRRSRSRSRGRSWSPRSSINLSGLRSRSASSSGRSRAPSRGSVRSRSSGSGSLYATAREVARHAASIALNAMTPGAGTAMEIAHGVSTQTRLNTQRNAGIRSGNSSYTGRLRKAKKNKKDPYVANGMKHVIETSGVVTDPDCVYVGQATYIPFVALEMVMQCLVRKLLEKANLSVTSVNDPIFPQQNTAGTGFIMQLDRIEANGTITTYPFTVPAVATIQTICGDFIGGVAPLWTSLQEVFIDYAVPKAVGQDLNTCEPFQLRLFEEVFNTAGSRYHRASINLRDVFVKSFFSSNIKIQNRTVSATGSEDAEAVSANPLYCAKYLFSGVPRQRDKTRMFKYPVAESGILTYGAAAAGNVYQKEPPSPHLFWNCSKNSKTVIQPGAIKSDRITLSKNMRLLRYIRWIGLEFDEQALPKTDRIKGPFMMYALEDVINVNLTQVISIAYEVNRVLGMYCYEKKVKFASGGVYQQTQDSEYVPPE